jgi:hypothetical protein
MKYQILFISVCMTFLFNSCYDHTKSKTQIINSIKNQDFVSANEEFEKSYRKSKDNIHDIIDSCFQAGSYLLSVNNERSEDFYFFALSAIDSYDLSFSKTIIKSLRTADEFDALSRSIERLMHQNHYNTRNYVDSCFDIGVYYFENNINHRAFNIGKSSMRLMNSFNIPISGSLYRYLSHFENLDDIFDIIDDLQFSDFNYRDFSQVIMTLNLKNRNEYNATLKSAEVNTTTELWLFPSEFSPEFNRAIFGYEHFNPSVAYVLLKNSIDVFNSLSSDDIIRSIKRNYLYFSDSRTYLYFSMVPDLQKEVNILKNRTEFEIAAQRDNFIDKLLEMRSVYIRANLKYVANWYNISGIGYISKKNYDINNQKLNIHIYFGKLYIGTVETFVSLEEAQTLFAKRHNYSITIDFIVSPSMNRSNLGIAGYGWPAWSTPSFYIAKEPVVIISSSENLNLQARTKGLRGYIWKDVWVRRWDMHRSQEPWQVRIIDSERF